MCSVWLVIVFREKGEEKIYIGEILPGYIQYSQYLSFVNLLPGPTLSDRITGISPGPLLFVDGFIAHFSNHSHRMTVESKKT